MYRSLIRTSLVRQLGSKVPSRIISRGYSSSFSRGFSIQNRMIAGFAGIGAGLIGVGLIGSSFAIQNDVNQEKFDDEFKQALEETKKELEDVRKALEESALAETKSDREEFEEEFDEEFKQAWGFAAKVFEDVLTLAVNPDQESEERSYESAVFNPQTGEINWDGPGLGALTVDGPCSKEFREALSCFLYSGSDPKGIECARKFEFMNYCFEKYPEHYMEKWYGGVEPEGEFDTTTPAEENSEAPVSETAK